MEKLARFFKNLFYTILFIIISLVVIIIGMLLTDGKKIDKEGLSRGFVKQEVNVRSGAGTEHKILKTLSPGNRFYIADTLDNGWLQMILGSENTSFSREDESLAYISGKLVFPIEDYDSWVKEQDRVKEIERKRQKQEYEKQLNKSDSYLACQDFIKKQLKAPLTAKFPREREVTINEPLQNRYIVIGYVDAQNSFGAMLRNNFVCDIRRNESSWTLLDLEITD